MKIRHDPDTERVFVVELPVKLAKRFIFDDEPIDIGDFPAVFRDHMETACTETKIGKEAYVIIKITNED